MLYKRDAFKISALLLLLLLFVNSNSKSQEKKLVEFGFIERIRQEYYKNRKDLGTASSSEVYNYFRIRTSPWLRLNLSSNVYLYTKLTNEFKPYIKPDENFDIDELVFDNFFVDIKNVFKTPLNLRIGRQDLEYGEGFLIMEGTPLDGSRTYYFNAIKLNYNFRKTSLDMFFISQPQKDSYLPKFNNKDRKLVEQDESSFGTYMKHNYFKRLSIENYYIYKKEESSPQTKLHTLGARVVYSHSIFNVRGELAYQFGKKGENDKEGLGGYLFLDIIANREKTNNLKFTIGYIHLSGDDPKTNDDEAWDPLFSRYPWQSDLYIFTLSQEGGLAYWSNLQLYKVCFSINLTPKAKLTSSYNYLMANENTFSTKPIFDDSGKTRGILLQNLLEINFRKNISGHLQFEQFNPGNYYTSTADKAYFLRWQLIYKF